MTGVSVVVPVKDGAGFLPECLANIREQKGVTLEVIVVDDGSSDGSAEIAEEHGADRVIRLEHTLGVSHARNLGIAASSAGLVCPHDVDDLMRPGKLALQAAMLEGSSQAGGVLVEQLIDLAPGVAPPLWLTAHPAMLDVPTSYAGSALFRVGALILAGGYEETMARHQDVDLIIRLRAATRPCLQLSRPLLVRRIHGRNATSRQLPEEGWFAAARAAQDRRRNPRDAMQDVPGIPHPPGFELSEDNWGQDP